MISAASGPQPRRPSPGSSADHRRERRLPLSAPAEPLEVYDPQTGWQPLPGRVMDVSARGAGLLVDRPLAPQTRVRISFPVPPHFSFVLGGGWEQTGGSLRERGRVVHCRAEPGPESDESGKDTPHLWRIGVALPPAPPSERDHIAVRVLCVLVLLLLFSATTVVRAGEGGTEGLVVFAAVILAILVAAEAHYFLERRGYRAAADRWVEAMGEAPDEVQLRRHAGRR
jgi:hypothetical protein